MENSIKDNVFYLRRYWGIEIEKLRLYKLLDKDYIHNLLYSEEMELVGFNRYSLILTDIGTIMSVKQLDIVNPEIQNVLKILTTESKLPNFDYVVPKLKKTVPIFHLPHYVMNKLMYPAIL